MRLGTIQGLAATAIVGGALFHSLAASPSLGDEPRGIGRLFRIGGSPPPAVPPGSRSSSSSKATEPAPATANRDLSGYYGQPALTTPPSTLPGASSGPRVTPKPRVNKPATEADPVVTRVSLGRSDDGSQFAMFLQVYADGTVIDSSGVHKLGPDALKPVVEAVASGDLAKVKGHCGGPAGDFIENVHVVVYDRAYGKLRANSFSYSGTTQGCDHAVHHLQTVLENLQARISPASPASATIAPIASDAPATGSLTTPPLPLTTLP